MKVIGNFSEESQDIFAKDTEISEGNVILATCSGRTWLNKDEFQEDNKKEIIVIKIEND